MKYFISFLLVLIFCLNLSAENNDLVNYYDSELIKISMDNSSGLSISYQGQSSGTSMGISDGLYSELQAYPDSKISIQNYKQKNKLGNILLWGGLGLSLGAAYYPLLSTDFNQVDTSIYGYSYFEKYQTSIYLMLGGLVAEIIGSFMLPQSYQELVNSVNQYNRNKIKEY